jgi:death-on-curing protein
MTVRFLELDEVLALHAEQIELYGGSAGVRDLGLLESAVAAAQASFDGVYLHGTFAEMAAAYLFHLAQNHPFVDGNKRIAAAAMIMFVYLNDRELELSEDDLVELTVGVASGAVTKSALAVQLADRIR